MPDFGNDWKTEKLVEGVYMSTGLLQNVSNGSSTTFVLQNNTEDRVFLVDPQSIVSETKVTAEKWFNAEVSGGSSREIVNKNSEYSRTFGAATQGATVDSTSSAEEFTTKLLGSNVGSIKAGGKNGGTANVLHPGDSMVYRLNNEGSNPADIKIDVDFIAMEK